MDSDPSPAVSLDALRRDYGSPGGALRKADLSGSWWTQLEDWIAETVADGRQDQPQAAVLATASADGVPSARTVLLKAVDSEGLVFATNRTSAKARDLTGNPRGTLCLSWVVLERQVIASGPVSYVSDEQSDDIWRNRPRGAQLGAWASQQSEVVASRDALVAQLEAVTLRFEGVEEVPRPPGWGGYRLHPLTVEFWQGQRDRLHDRLRWRLDGGGWVLERLQP